jgi:hypothetical protein
LLLQWADGLDAESAAAVIEALAVEGRPPAARTPHWAPDRSLEERWRAALDVRDSDWKRYNSPEHQKLVAELAAQVADARGKAAG